MKNNVNLYNPAQRFRELISQGVVVGVFSKSTDPSFIEILGITGFDFVVLDLEHGPNSVLTLSHLIRAAEVTGLFPIVRIKEDTLTLISEVLDLGAGGVQVPKVAGKEDVEKVLEAAKFEPHGMRGVCRFVRAAHYSHMDRFEYFKQANRSVTVIQLEGNDAIGNLQEIITVPGLDIVFIGPYDLSQSLGVAGRVGDPLVVRAMESIIEECNRQNIAVGIFADTMEEAEKWIAAGVKYLCFSVDVGLFTEKCQDTVHCLRGLKKEERTDEAQG